MRLKKLLAKIFIIFSIFSMVLMPVVLVEEGHHDCNHEDCPICEVIQVAKETIKQLDKPVHSTSIIFVLPLLFAFVACIAYIDKNKDYHTLVTLRIKLSD